MTLPALLADRVRESNVVTGTGAVTLGGSVSGFRTFASVMTNGQTTWYAIVDNTTNDWEVGLGTWNTGNTLTRTTVLASSNSNSLVNFLGNSCDCFIDLPASGVATILSSLVTAGNLGAVINSGTVQINNVVTLTGTASGTLTIGPGSGTSDVVVNMPTGGGTVTLAAAPVFKRQRVEVDVKQGATVGSLLLNSGFIFGTSGGPSSFTLTATAGLTDRLMLLSPDGTHFAVMAINQGFTL